MSEFKFACPVCGQHITADSSASGGQVECPTCFQKIVVPQAPASRDTKFILSASQVSKPRPTVAEAVSRLGPLQPASRRSLVPAIVCLLVLACAAGAGLYFFRGKLLKPAPKGASAATNAPKPAPTGTTALNTTYPVPTNIQWTLDLANAVIPEAPVVGRIHGSGFRCERALLRGGLLSLSQGKGWPWDLGVSVILLARRGQELSGKTVEIPADRLRARPVILRWKDEQHEPASSGFRQGYALKLVFGEATNGRMPGKIYLSLPDPEQSFVAGTFDAEIKKPEPPKPPRRSPPPPRP